MTDNNFSDTPEQWGQHRGALQGVLLLSPALPGQELVRPLQGGLPDVRLQS